MTNIDQFFQEISKGISTYAAQEKSINEETRRIYLHAFSNFLSYVGIHLNKFSSVSEIFTLYYQLINQTYKKNTAATYIKAITNILNWLKNKKLLNTEIELQHLAVKTKTIVKKEKLEKNLVAKLLNFKEFNLADKRDKIILKFLTQYDLAAFQIVNIDAFDFIHENKKMKLNVITKVRKEKIKKIILNPQFAKEISGFLSQITNQTKRSLNKNSALFTSFSKRNTDERISEKTINRIIQERALQVGLEDIEIDINKIKGVLSE